MPQNIITAGDATNGALITQGGNDGTLLVQTGPAGGKVNAINLAADGTPTLIKGPTIGNAPTPVPSGSAPIYGCRAWCVFNGTTAGTNAPTGGGNVTSVTRNSAGDYTINFTKAMPDANYSAVFGYQGDSTSPTVNARVIHIVTPTTTSLRIQTIAQGSGGALLDFPLINVSIFR